MQMAGQGDQRTKRGLRVFSNRLLQVSLRLHLLMQEGTGNREHSILSSGWLFSPGPGLTGRHCRRAHESKWFTEQSCPAVVLLNPQKLGWSNTVMSGRDG